MRRFERLDLPAGASAWTTGETPVRRVGANYLHGRAGLTLSQDLLKHPALHHLLADVIWSGDAWLDMEGQRVAPRDVVITRAEAIV